MLSSRPGRNGTSRRGVIPDVLLGYATLRLSNSLLKLELRQPDQGAVPLLDLNQLFIERLHHSSFYLSAFARAKAGAAIQTKILYIIQIKHLPNFWVG